MTDPTRDTEKGSNPAETPTNNEETPMKDVDHTHPQTRTAFGMNYYDDGTVAADGGHEPTEETMADVDHEPPTKGATRSFERGVEGRDKTV